MSHNLFYSYEYLKLVHTCVHGDFGNRANFAFRVFCDERKLVSREAIREASAFYSEG